MVLAMAAVPRPVREIATLIINPKTGKQIDEELVPLVFADELKSAQAKYDLLCASSMGRKLKEGDNFLRWRFGAEISGVGIGPTQR